MKHVYLPVLIGNECLSKIRYCSRNILFCILKAKIYSKVLYQLDIIRLSINIKDAMINSKTCIQTRNTIIAKKLYFEPVNGRHLTVSCKIENTTIVKSIATNFLRMNNSDSYKILLILLYNIY